MSGASKMAEAARTRRALSPHVGPGQIVLVFQGGGALGAYQAGVYQALHEAGIEPDWIIGTSIGAINASLIAGNAPEQRLGRLKEFWDRMALQGPLARLVSLAAVLPGFVLLEHGDPRHPGLLRAQPHGVLGQSCRAGVGQGRLLLDLAPREDAVRARRFLARQSLQAAPHGRRRARAHQPDALLRRSRHGDRRQAHPGLGRPAAGVPGRAHRRRAVLGRRHSLQHAHRSDLRRQPAAQLSDLRRAHVEPDRTGAGDDVGGHASPEGHPVFEPGRQPHHPADADPSPAPRHQGAARLHPRGYARQ